MEGEDEDSPAMHGSKILFGYIESNIVIEEDKKIDEGLSLLMKRETKGNKILVF